MDIAARLAEADHARIQIVGPYGHFVLTCRHNKHSKRLAHLLLLEHSVRNVGSGAKQKPLVLIEPHITQAFYLRLSLRVQNMGSS